MTHEQALEAAQGHLLNEVWKLLEEDGDIDFMRFSLERDTQPVNVVVRAYLEARAETDDDHREAGNPFQCEGCSADQLLADFGGDE